MQCPFAKNFIAANAKEFFTGGIELRRQLTAHLEICSDCQAYIMEAVQPVLHKIANNPEAAHQFQEVIALAEKDLEELNNAE